MSAELAIREKIRRFDLISLLHALDQLGYREAEIRFKSHASLESQNSLIEDIEFQTQPHRQAVIKVNMGLLGAQSPLPSYFFKRMESDRINTHAYISFIEYFDHVLLRNYLRALYPETDPFLFKDWEQTKRHYLQLLDLKSPKTLHFLFSLVFPELGAAVEKAALKTVVQTTFPRLGTTTLGGEAVFGKKINAPIMGNRITLFSDGDFTGWGIPWAKEIRSRLDTIIFPILKKIGIDLEILLIIKSQKGWMKLHKESYLGYDRIQGGKMKARRIRIFQGHIGEKS